MKYNFTSMILLLSFRKSNFIGFSLQGKQDCATMSSVLFSIRQRTSEAIRHGAPMYNSGNISGCEKIYMNLQQEIISDCEKNITSSNKDQNSKNLLINTHKIMKNIKLLPSDGVNVSKSNSDKNAWALRNGLDKILLYLEQNQSKSIENIIYKILFKVFYLKLLITKVI